MNKIERCKKEIRELINIFLNSMDKEVLLQFLTKNSNLPGRRANIELANSFAAVVTEYKNNITTYLWDFCLFLISFTPDKAKTNDPKEFLSFCGAWAIGSIGASNPNYFQDSLSILKRLSSDSRWRMREAVAFGIQELLKKVPNDVLIEFITWIADENWLTYRAIAAGIAHPSVLVERRICEIALEIHGKIFSKIISSKNLNSEEFKICKKGLSYTLSVVIFAIPGKGFKFIDEYSKIDNKHIQIILRENLKKNRLKNKFPKEVQLLNQKLRK